jgi:hypothetical protein
MRATTMHTEKSNFASSLESRRGGGFGKLIYTLVTRMYPHTKSFQYEAVCMISLIQQPDSIDNICVNEW